MKKSKLKFIVVLFLIVAGVCLGVSLNGCSKKKSENRNPLKAEFYQQLLTQHQIKKLPGPYDWMAQHKEPGQTFDQYVSGNVVKPDDKHKYIYITLLGDFDDISKDIVNKTAKYLEVYYSLPVKFTEPVPLSVIPEKAKRVHPKWEVNQILSTYVIDEVLVPLKPEDAFCLIAFTSSDLWPGGGWNFVFGQASMTDRVGIWSIFRNGDPKKSKDEYQLCLARTMKTGAHEIGHMFSLDHCIFFECAMNGSNHRKESDDRPVWLCPVCLRKLIWNLEIDPIKRYKDLADINREYGFIDDAFFFEKSLNLLEGESK